jgi:hypothetical protein
MSTKNKFVSPAGIAQYPWLQPGRPDTAFDPEGKYKVELRLAPGGAKHITDLIERTRAENFGANDNVHYPFKIEEDTGEYSFKMQSKYQPKYYDAKGNPIPIEQVPPMFSGSELRASGQIDAYTNGVKKGISLRLAAIQIINPVSGGTGDHAGDFDSVEGFEVSGDSQADSGADFNDELEDF